jgi:hypothetical protein
VPWPLNSDEDGWPLLPGLKELRLVQIKDIVRSFLTLIYREFFICSSKGKAILIRPIGKTTNNNKAHVPWAAITNNPDKFLDTKYLPDDTSIIEISRMRSAPLVLCYKRWIKAQKKGELAFKFKHVFPEDRRDDSRKRSQRKRELNVSEDEEGSDEDIMQTKKWVKLLTPVVEVEEPQKDLETAPMTSNVPDRFQMSPEGGPDLSSILENSLPANGDQLSSDKLSLIDQAAPLAPERSDWRCYFF